MFRRASQNQETVPERDFIEISLAWGQKTAAFWSIFWPFWVALPLAVGYATPDSSVNVLKEYQWIFALGGTLLILCGQGLLIPRLVRKNYRTFWIAVFREGVPNRSLSIGEVVQIWLQVLWPQLILLIAAGVALEYAEISPVLKQNSVFNVGIWALLVGPIAMHVALRKKYRGFRLQPYWRQRWAKVPSLDELIESEHTRQSDGKIAQEPKE